MTSFVTLGNMTQPFPRLLRAVEAIAADLPGPIVAQAGHTPWAPGRLEVVAFLPQERFLALVRSARVVIMHAGAGSLIHALHAGRMPVVMARRAALGEAVDDHQAELADAFERQGRIRVATDAASLRAAVRDALDAAAPPVVPPRAAMIDLVAAAIRTRLSHGRR